MGKSSKHRTQNVHHFVPFSARISNVNVDVIHQIRRQQADDEAGTYFTEALLKWTELDLTDHFTSFRREISGQVQTFEQLVHHKEDIISSLKTHLAVSGSLALESLLDLLVQLARDLQQDFVPHFRSFFELLITILSSRSQDVEALEQTFQALAFLFRFLWRFLIKDFKEMFSYFSALLVSSQKDYIRVFAAESCGYLLRKVKKQNELLNFLFGQLKSQPELTEGVGLLLFEVFKGVQYHFHTISEEVFPLVLHKLGVWSPQGKKVKLPRAAVEESVTVLMKECAEHTSREHCATLWKLLLECITQIHTACLEKEAEGEEKNVVRLVAHLCCVLRLTSLWLTHKNGSIVTEPDEVALTFCVLMKTPCHLEVLGSDLLAAVCNLLTGCQERLSVGMIVKVISLVFTAPLTLADLKQFVKSLIDMPFFEKDILPGLMTRLHRDMISQSDAEKQEVLAFITEVVFHKNGSPLTGEDLYLLQVFPLEQGGFRSNKEANSFTVYVEQVVEQMTQKEGRFPREQLAALWGAVVCWPHLSIKESLKKVGALWRRLIQEQTLQTAGEESGKALVPVLNQLLKTIVTVSQSSKTQELPVEFEPVLDVVRTNPSCPLALQILDFFLSCPQTSHLLTEQKLKEVYILLEYNLVSASHKVRLLTCHILSLFPAALPDYGDDVSRECVFKSMVAAEKLEPNVQTYREKLVHLRKLDCQMAAKCLPQGPFSKAPLLFLIGNEFWNFKLLWNPLSEIITSHAQDLDIKEFWDVMLEQLRRAAEESEKELQCNSLMDNSKEEEEMSSLMSLFTRRTSEIAADARKPDFTNFRVQLWRAMKKFPEKCVLRSDELCTLYMNFLKNELSNTDEETSSTQDISAQVPDLPASEEEEAVMMELGPDEEDMEPSMPVSNETKSSAIKRKKAAILSLLVHLDLFALFKKQRSMFNTAPVKDTFYEFLKHRISSVQKAAFDCILTYKSPDILPYRENFNRLLDDKTFKSEVVLFRVDEETSEVKAENRAGLLPVLMRILYGKMHGKAGNETAGKSRSHVRRSIVLRFLGGCRPDELKYFLELLFQPCLHFISEDPVTVIKDIQANLDLKKMIPLKKMKGILNSLDTVINKLGHRLGDFSHGVLQILLGLTATLNTALTYRDKVVSGVVNLLKSLRHTCVKQVTQFLESFDDIDLSAGEIWALFDAVVWPQADKLVLEGVHHPTPLLNLFILWSRVHRFFPLLDHKKQESESAKGELTPLSCVFSLLNAPSINPSVATAIMNLVSSILSEEDESEWEGRKKPPPLPKPFIVVPDVEGRSVGEHLLLPHIPQLLTYLQAVLKKVTAEKNSKKQSSVMELKILARVSSFVTSPSECSALCDLLVPFLKRSSNISEEVEENTILSLTNLMQYISKPHSFYRSVACLFMSVERRESRSLLCKLFSVVSARDTKLTHFAALVSKLNAWDPRRAEEPDYAARLAAFQAVNALVKDMEKLDQDILLPIVYNSCYFINLIDDLSIRDNATHCLVAIVTKIASIPNATKAFSSILAQTLVGQVKLGMRSKSEAVRHEFITVLQSLVNKFPTHPMFSDLTHLCDKDLEADFFENIRHIQMHKRSRALRRLLKHLRGHSMKPDILLSYFVPLVYNFILDKAYAKHANIQDASIELLGAICKQLPWQQYLQLMRFYLNLLPKKVELQKQIVRIIVVLLDSFHFDLRNSQFLVKLVPKEVDTEAKQKENPDSENKSTETEEVELGSNSEEPMDESLPLNLDTVGGETEQGETEHKEVVDGKVICKEAMATRIHRIIVLSLLPQLHTVITQRAKSDDEHRKNKSKYPEDEEILRVPIALAMVKLLQNLPQGTLENRLPGILMKICFFLRSRSKDIRVTARETLEKVALSLGPRFFPFIVKELKGSLVKGYQLHVLSYTVHSLLKSLIETISPGDLDPAIDGIQEVFQAELFGQVAEEKEVAAIKAKYFEAKFVKGYEAYELLARGISGSALDRLIRPVKQVLETTHNHRIAHKGEMLLRKVADGLQANSSIPLETMMVFIFGLTVKLMPQLAQVIKPKFEDTDDVEKQGRIPESCLLLGEVMPHGGHKPKASKRTNVHILIEFGLQLLNLHLKKSSLLPTEHLHLQLLDPLISAVRDCLNDSHVKTNSNAMRCLSWLLRFPLPSLKENIEKIATGMFVVLQNYAGAATAKGDNLELVSMCFKAVTVLVREVTYYQISKEQLQVLLTYCEEDLYNYSRQSTAFNLIRAILTRKLDIPQLHQVMQKVFKMSITGSAVNIRLQSRQVVLHYLMNYPQGQSLAQNLYFYLDHLQYELDDGRESALEMLVSIFSNFPQTTLHRFCSRFFHDLSMASYNDNSSRCRKLVGVAMRTLLGKIDNKQRKILFQDVVKWIKSDDLRVRAMGCNICGMFVEVEGGRFEHHLSTIIPILQQQLEPGRYDLETETDEESLKVEQKDACLVAVLTTCLKIVRELNIVRQPKFQEDFDQIWSHTQSHLQYPHAQVRLVSCQLIGLMFSAWEPSELADKLTQGQEDDNSSFLLKDTPALVKKFANAFCVQLRTPFLEDALATQVVKNLLFLGKVSEALDQPNLLIWLAKRVVKEANFEVIHNVKVTVKRNHTFKWVAAMGISLCAKSLVSLLPTVLPVMQRELGDHAQDQELKTLAQEVIDLLKKQVGVEAFTSAFANSQKMRLEKREIRKRQMAEEAVTNPEIAARKKIKHNLKKRELKKRKFDEKKPAKRIKKSKLSILNVKVDDD